MMAINMGGSYDGNKHGGGGVMIAINMGGGVMMAINMGGGYDDNKHGTGL